MNLLTIDCVCVERICEPFVNSSDKQKGKSFDFERCFLKNFTSADGVSEEQKGQMFLGNLPSSLETLKTQCQHVCTRV